MKEKLTEDNKVYKCLVPANLAALLINGTTIHNFSCELKKFKSFMKMKSDYIFVDEVSNTYIVIFTKFQWFLRN